MTNDELLAREAIRHTMACYHIAGDGNDAGAYAAVFTEDAVIEGGPFQVEGRARIRDWKAERAKTSPARFVRHNLTTSRIELTGPDTATGRSYFVVFTEAGPDHCGTYDDVFRRVGDRWLIARREVRTDWHAPNSRFRPTPPG